VSMINCLTMKRKVAVTLDSKVLDHLDELVAAERFPNRSQAIEAAVIDKLERIKHTRLARESAKLNQRDEQKLADEGLAADAETWPVY
jgi:metal-responsive CopG/Arc/MetJ family transcriptional regulator